MKSEVCLFASVTVVIYSVLPFAFQSTCAVHAGASGGPLLSSDGKLVGIVACNAK